MRLDEPDVHSRRREGVEVILFHFIERRRLRRRQEKKKRKKKKKNKIK